jgi:hypothetical protein
VIALRSRPLDALPPPNRRIVNEQRPVVNRVVASRTHRDHVLAVVRFVNGPTLNMVDVRPIGRAAWICALPTGVGNKLLLERLRRFISLSRHLRRV